MALRLRRGTNAERQLITPLEGEPIFTTDTKDLYIGDGSTAGGIKVGGDLTLNDLTDVDTSGISVGQVLKWNGSTFVPGDATGLGIVEGNNYRINIVADDSGIIVDTTTSTVTGNFVGDGSGLFNLPVAAVGSIFDLDDVFNYTTPDIGDVLQYDGANFVPQKIKFIEGDDSSIMLDTSTNTFTGNFVGDGSGLFNLPTISSIFDLDDVFSFTPPDPGDILTFDGVNFVPQKIKFIQGDDSSIMLDTSTNTFTGNFVGDVLAADNTIMVDALTKTITGDLVGTLTGNVFGSLTGTLLGTVDGDLSGSVFGDDSTILIDGVNSRITAREFVNSKIFAQEDGTRVNIDFEARDLTNLFATYAELNFTGIDTNGVSLTASRIFSGAPGTFFVHDPAGVTVSYPESKTIALTNTGITYGSYTATAALDIRGDAIITGGLTADVTGSLFSDSSTMLIDGTDGKLLVENINITGITTNTPADTGSVDSWLEVTVNGATKYIPLYA